MADLRVQSRARARARPRPHPRDRLAHVPVAVEGAAACTCRVAGVQAEGACRTAATVPLQAEREPGSTAQA